MQAPAYIVLAVHGSIAFVLIVVGAVLIALGSIGQDTYLAMVSGALGLISGGGAAMAIHNSLLHAMTSAASSGNAKG